MSLQEFYDSIGGNYQDVRERLMKETLIRRLLIKFLDDMSYDKLMAAMEKKDYGEAFRAVHTLKGLSQNFGFDRLIESTHALTETLRRWESEVVDEEKCEQQWQQVTLDYAVISGAIRKLKESEQED